MPENRMRCTCHMSSLYCTEAPQIVLERAGLDHQNCSLQYNPVHGIKGFWPCVLFVALYTMVLGLIVGSWFPCTWGFSPEIQLPLLETIRVVFLSHQVLLSLSLSSCCPPGLFPPVILLRTRHRSIRCK